MEMNKYQAVTVGKIDPRSATKVGRVQNALIDLARDLRPGLPCTIIAMIEGDHAELHLGLDGTFVVDVVAADDDESDD